MNKAFLMGRFTRDPELKTTPQGTSVSSFTLAVNRRYVKGEERKADFINCVAWRHTADFICTYFKKGDPIIVEGSIQTRSWDDNNGQKRYATEVVISEAMFVENKRPADGSSGGNYQPGGNNGGYGGGPSSGSTYQDPMDALPTDFGSIGTDDDLPF